MNADKINHKARELYELIKEEKMDPRKGLPEELFLLASYITPIPNIDLMVLDDRNRLLLSWRNDPFFGQGWHLPGGCIRMHETLEQRIRKTALDELGSDNIEVNLQPICVKDAIAKLDCAVGTDDFLRSHNVAVLFLCRANHDYDLSIINGRIDRNDQGYLKWFDTLPENLLPALLKSYSDVLSEWKEGKIKWIAK